MNQVQRLDLDDREVNVQLKKSTETELYKNLNAPLLCTWGRTSDMESTVTVSYLNLHFSSKYYREQFKKNL